MAQTDSAAQSQQSQQQYPQPPLSNVQQPPTKTPEEQDAEEQEQEHEPSLSTLSRPAQLDLAVSLIFNSWPALTLAVQSSWGGPTSVEKRDWLCGAVADLFTSRPDTDALDLEEVLVQVMNDEFDVVVDDGSAAETAGRICEVRGEVGKGQFGKLRGLWDEWKMKKGGKEARDMFKRVEAGEEDQETDDEWEDEDEDDDDDGDKDDDDGDVDMADVSAVPRQPRERIEPEVDGDGFTKVVAKKKR